jgi:hypothetical protein
MAVYYWVGGTGNWDGTSQTNWSLSSGGSGNQGQPTSTDSVVFDANSNVGTGSFTVTITALTAPTVTNFTISGLDGAMTLAGTIGLTVTGNFTLPSTNLTITNTGPLRFNSSSTATILTNGVSIPMVIAFNGGTTSTYLLGSALTTTKAVTHSIGTLDLAGYTLTALTFTSNTTSTRTITSSTGTGQIVVTGTGTVINCSGTGSTTSGTWGFTISNNSATSATVTNSIYRVSTLINTGTYTLTLTSGNVYVDLNFTGFSGTWSPASTTHTLTGNLTIPASGGTYGTATSGVATLSFTRTSGTSTITTNGRTVAFGIGVNGVGGTVQFADNFSQTSTVAFSLTNGTLDLNNKTASIGNLIILSGTHSFINPSAGVLNCATVTHTSGDLSIGSGYNLNCSGAYTFTAGTLTINDGVTLNVGQFSSSNSNTRSISFGTGDIYLNGSGTIWNMATITGFTCTGTKNVYTTYNGTTACTINAGAAGSTNCLNFFVTTGSFILYTNLGGAGNIGNLNFTGFSGTHSINTTTIYGDILYSSTMSTAAGGTLTFSPVLTGTSNITTNGVVINGNITITATSASLRLNDNLTMGSSYTLTLTSGTLDLNGFALTTSIISSSNTNTRTIAFGTTGSILINTAMTANTTIWNIPTLSGYSFTGSWNATINTTGNFTATILHGSTSGGSVTTALRSLTVLSSVGTLSMTGHFVDIDMSGSGAITIANTTKTMYGTLIFGSSNTTTTGALVTTFTGNSYTKAINTNGVFHAHPITIDAAGDSFSFNSAYSSGRPLIINNGTVNTNNYNITTSNIALGAGTKTLNLGSSTITVGQTGSSTTVWDMSTNSSGLTLNMGTANIIITLVGNSLTMTFSGGGYAYNKLSFAGSYTGSIYTIVGDNSFTELESLKTVAFTVNFTSGSTTTVQTWSLNGTSGNLITIKSSTAGTPATLSKSSGTVNASYLSIKDSTATGGATWNAYTTNGNVDAGGNSGWIFTAITPSNVNSNFFVFFF